MDLYENLEKDDSIIDIIKKLKNELGYNFKIFDYWVDDGHAIGIKQGIKLIYICTAGYIDEESLKYDFDFELDYTTDISNLDEPYEYTLIKSHLGLSEKGLLSEIASFWENPGVA